MPIRKSFSLILIFLFMIQNGYTEVDSITDRIIRGAPVFLETEDETVSLYATDNIARVKNLHIPFTMDNHDSYWPIIEMRAGTVPLKMGFQPCGLGVDMEAYTTFVRKIGGADLERSVWNSIREETMAQYPDREPDKFLMNDIINRHLTSFRVYDIKINDINMGQVDASFYDAQEYYDSDEDGVIGLLFFANCDNIIIDYRNNEIVVNAPAISSEGSPMRVLEGSCSIILTKVMINGVEQDAVIAPTASSVYLRDDYKSKKYYSDQEILSYCYNGKSRNPTDKYKNVTVDIDGITVHCKGYFTSRAKGEMAGEFLNHMMRKVNFLGYPVFKGHRIQFDLKQGLFRMD